ncbi:MAG: DHA2 family efflux MFS transporter permease subunit [Candidatus Ancillula sp.]|jgi:EmrB/QacA subfamily drug resistance transporter|nr:DHA2 family efflux MFS transporter permease subunit [Candidatus Ancillula sp.]
MPNQNSDKLSKPLIIFCLTMMLGMLAPGLDTTIVNVSVDTIAKDLGLQVDIAQLLVTAYVLCMGIAIPFASWLVDKFHARSLFIIIELVFGITCVICALVPNFALIMVCRLIQGFMAGCMSQLTQTSVMRATKPSQRGRMMAILSVPMTVIPVFGPTIGGIIVNWLPWQFIFWVNVPICFVAALLGLKFIPLFTPLDNKRKLDVIGNSLLAPAFALLLIGITALQNSLLTSLIAILLGLALLIIYSIYSINSAKKGKDTVLNLTLLRIPTYTSSVVAVFFCGMLATGVLFILPLFFQNDFGETPFMAGIILASQGFGIMAARLISGILLDKIDARYIASTGVVLATLGTAIFIFEAFWSNYSIFLAVLALIVRGAGQGCMFGTFTTTVYYGLTKKQIADGTTATRMMQQLGGSFGTAILAICLQMMNNNFAITFAISTLTALVVIFCVPFLKYMKNTNTLTKDDVAQEEQEIQEDEEIEGI